jgi:DNA primase
VVESESDALALIDAGYETPFDEHGSCVIAVPGASSWKPQWSALLAGREVHLWPDRDTAGNAFCDAVATSCQQITRTIQIHQLA